MPAINFKGKSPDPPQKFWSKLAANDIMFFYSTKAEAGVALLKQVRETLLDRSKMRDPKKLLDIARPTTRKSTQLRPSLSREVDTHLFIRHSLVMSLISFAGSELLHVIVVWIYHRYKHRNSATLIRCGLFYQKKPRTPFDFAETNKTQLAVIDSAPREYSQLARTISLSQKFPNKIAFDAETKKIKRIILHAFAPQQTIMSFNYQATDSLEHYKSQGDIRGEQCCMLKVFSQTVEKGPLLFQADRV